jgi:hypothetical protein
LEPFQIQNPLLHSLQKATEHHQFSLSKKTPKSTDAHSAKPCPKQKHKWRRPKPSQQATDYAIQQHRQTIMQSQRERHTHTETERTATKAKNLAGKQSHNVCMCVWGKNTTYRREMK